VDGVLPDGTGLAVAEDAEWRGIPTIVVTGYGFRFPKRDLAGYPVLLKPARPAELLEAVEQT
jgi:hypothetical protein